VVRRVIEAVCAGVALLAGAVLILRVLYPPFRSAAGSTFPLKAEGLFAVSVIVLALMRKPAPETETRRASPAASWRRFLAPLVLVVVITAFFCSSLWLPLNTDDFTHMELLTQAAGRSPALIFTAPAGGPLDFRPLGILTYYWELRWMGISAFPRHVFDLLLHLLNCLLIYWLAGRLGLRAPFDLVAALLFGLHGTRPEVVCWPAARFDSLAALFVLAGLAAFLRWEQSGGRKWYLAACCACLLGLLSKESAYVFPLLVTAAWAPRQPWRRWRALAPFYLVTGLVFAYRWRLVGGIGGYLAGRTGEPAVLQLRPLKTLEALSVRIWATLWFPVNWSDGPGLVLSVATGCVIVASLWLALRGTRRQAALFSVAFVLLAALPVQHLLLIGPDLEKSRYLYLPSAGFAVLLGALAGSMPSRRAAWLVATALVAFQAAALTHNLATWARVTSQGFENCSFLANELRQHEGPASVVGLPHVVDGVYNLSHGFGGCLWLYHGIDLRRVEFVPDLASVTSSASAPRRVYVWDPSRKGLVLGYR
jgi:hypothetical protein